MAKRIKKWCQRILFSLIFIVLIGCISLALLLEHWTAKPPPLPVDKSVLQLKPEARDGKVWLGKSWAGQREGLPVVYLTGSPLEMGYAHGVLMQKQMHTLETEFFKMIEGYVPQRPVRNLLKNYIIYRNRDLSDHVPLDYRLELYGTTLGCSDRHPEEGSFYNRLLNYHAAHDVSYMMIDNPLISRAGCTAFGAWGAATKDGHLLTGRNFDWEAAEVFSRDRVVVMCEPEGGIPFLSLSWAGMAGVVSGINRAGVSVTINGAPSSLPGDTATPAAMVARDILQRAHNLSEALEILRQSKVFVSTLWLLGARTEGKFVIVEKTPETMNVYESSGETIVSANHFQTAGLKDGPKNKSYMEESTSVSRSQRLTELLSPVSKNLAAAQAVVILRDRKLPGGKFVGNGQRATLNAFIATHATVMDLTEGIFWAASPPNQLGKFVAFDVNDFARELPERTIAADATLASGEYERARQAQQDLSKGQRALKAQDAALALTQAGKAETLNPGFYQNAALRGRALLALQRKAEAAQAFETALAQSPAFLVERRQLETLLKEAQAAQ